MRFGKEFTVPAFRAALGLTTLKVVKNPKTNKLFLSGDGRTVGKVSKSIDLTGHLSVVEMIDEEESADGKKSTEMTYCLVNQSDTNVLLDLSL